MSDIPAEERILGHHLAYFWLGVAVIVETLCKTPFEVAEDLQAAIRFEDWSRNESLGLVALVGLIASFATLTWALWKSHAFVAWASTAAILFLLAALLVIRMAIEDYWEH